MPTDPFSGLTEPYPVQGRVWLRFMGPSSSDPTQTSEYKVYLGHVSKIGMSFNKSTTVVPIVTKPADNAFPLDGGTTKEYTFTGSRVQPHDIDDTGSWENVGGYGEVALLTRQHKWSNMHWMREVTKMIDRWQMKTDGCDVVYSPASTNPYISIGTDNTVHGYIRSIEFTYNMEYNELLTFYLTFVVGTSRVRASASEYAPPYNETESTGYADMSVLLSDSDTFSPTPTNGGRWYEIGNVGADRDSAVDSCEIVGGPNEPFEHAVTTISCNKLKAMHPDLMDYIDKIIPGRNKLVFSFAGTSSHIVKSMSVSGGTLKLKSYCCAYDYKTSILQESYVEDTAAGIIFLLLGSGRYGPVFGKNNFEYAFRTEYWLDGPEHRLRFTEGTSIWRILQICAMYLGCKLFFADDKAYLIDYTIDMNALDPLDQTTYIVSDGLKAHRYVYSSDRDEDETLELYPRKGTASNKAGFMYGRTLSSSFGDQGADTMVTNLRIRCTDPSVTDPDASNIRTVEFKDDLATLYAEMHGSPNANHGLDLSMEELREGTDPSTGIAYAQATRFAQKYMEYMLEPQHSVTFRVKECTDDGWTSLFPRVAQADRISDRSKDFAPVENISIYTVGASRPRRYQLLYMSSYTRMFPDMTAEYEWGAINDIDLPNRLATDF